VISKESSADVYVTFFNMMNFTAGQERLDENGLGKRSVEIFKQHLLTIRRGSAWDNFLL